LARPDNRKQKNGYVADMKSTLDLPDDLMRTVKIRAVRENRKLKDMIADLLRLGLAQADDPGRAGVRVQLALVQTAREARPGEEMTPDRVAEVPDNS
jgi:plasmid stability protein